MNDDRTLKPKALITPQGNEDCVREVLRSHCFICPPARFRMVACMAVLDRCQLTKLDVKTAFLQTGCAERDVYLTPPNKSADWLKWLLLLLTAAYGLVNANAKCQSASGQVRVYIGLKKLPLLSQLFMMTSANGLMSLLAQKVDKFLICGPTNHADIIISEIKDHFEI